MNTPIPFLMTPPSLPPQIASTPELDAEAWQQVLARDAAADGRFVYAVSSTGVYCRPSCPSRRPARANVRFFSTPDDAEAAGFRACLRCQPRRNGAKEDPHAEAVRCAAAMLERDPGRRISLASLGEAVGLSSSVLQRAFERVLGVSPAAYMRRKRQERFHQELRAPGASVTTAVYAAGFGSSSRAYENTDATLGMKPSAMKAGGKDETIRWGVANSSLGKVLAAATERGLCAVLFAATQREAEASLRERFPAAILIRDDRELGEALDLVLSNLSENPSAIALPFDARATAFQQRVWKALREIPRGETRTYAQVAASIGAPRAVRAVGAACGANPLAIVVPCHRVVGASGELTGYRWGVERKRKLLAMERGAADNTAEMNGKQRKK